MKNVTNAMRAHILTAAVPYIKQYTDQYVVVKYGGNAMVDEELKKSVMKDLLLLQLVGVKVVLVHGGGPAINSTLEAMQIESQRARGGSNGSWWQSCWPLWRRWQHDSSS